MDLRAQSISCAWELRRVPRRNPDSLRHITRHARQMSDADNLEYRVVLRHAGRVRTGDQSLGRKSPVENAVEALALPPSTPQAVRRKVYRLSLVSAGAVEG